MYKDEYGREVDTEILIYDKRCKGNVRKLHMTKEDASLYLKKNHDKLIFKVIQIFCNEECYDNIDQFLSVG